jgi:hypothetical protein
MGSRCTFEIQGCVDHGRVPLSYPTFSKWTCYPLGIESATIIKYKPLKGHEPNFIRRWMQRVILGAVWVKEN